MDYDVALEIVHWYNFRKGGESMGRMTKKGIINANLWFWIGAVFFCLIGLAGIILALFPDIEPVVSRESLQAKEVTVAELNYHIQPRGANIYYIRTTDGEKYIISGSFDRHELVKDISVGKEITVKWYQSKWPAALLAEEIFADGKQVVFYDNDKKLDWRISFFLGCLGIFMGTACIAEIRYDRKLSTEAREKGKGTTKKRNKKKKR